MNGKSGPGSLWPSGEPPYRPSEWSSTVGTHNCYAYMLNDLTHTDRFTGKSQPCAVNGQHLKKISCRETLKCVLKDNPKHIVPYSLKKGAHVKAPPYHYKGFLMVSPDMDFHFARQDNRMLKVYNAVNTHLVNSEFLKDLLQKSKEIIPEIYQYIPKTAKTIKQKLRFLYKNSKTWSHKPGSTPVSDKDADGKLIFDPLKANWDFSRRLGGGINYSRRCCFFIIPMNTYRNTKSSGHSSFFAPNETNVNRKVRKNISATTRHQKIDARVRKLLNIR